MAENRRCQCTLQNNSSHDLINCSYDKSHGKWTNTDEKATTPQSEVKAGESTWWELTGLSGTGLGAEGWVKYVVGQYGVIQFNFGCPYSHDNYATCDVSSPLKYSVYAVSDKEEVGKDGPDTTINDYCEEGGTPEEGRIPRKGHPLSVLWIIEDADAPEGT